jgi:hypothetical protein
MSDPNEYMSGIRPEDVKVTPQQQAQIDSFLAEKRQEDEEDELIELHESEIMEAAKIMADLTAKYSSRKASFENLSSLRGEAEERFEKIGLLVRVDWMMSGLTGNPPEILIIGRLTDFNPERARFETGKGVADPFYDAKKQQRKKQNKLIVKGKG